MPMSEAAREAKRARDRARRANAKTTEIAQINNEQEKTESMATNDDLIIDAIRNDNLAGSPSKILLTMGIVDNDEYSQLREVMRTDGSVEFIGLPNTAYIPRSVSFPDVGHEKRVTWELVRADGEVAADEMFNHYARIQRVVLCP